MATYFQRLRSGFKGNFLKPSNILTQIRLLGSPIPGILLLIFPNDFSHRIAIIIVFAVIASTDIFDGVVARARGEVTKYGELLDPIADMFFGLLTLAALSVSDEHAQIILIVLLSRQLHLCLMHKRIQDIGKSMSVVFSGKVKTVAVSVFTVLLLLPSGLINDKLFDLLTVVVCAITLYSWLSYAGQFSRIIGEKID